MKRVLVVEYSQSGDVAKVADAFTRPLERPGVEVRRERLQPAVPYPYPWGSLRRLFSVFPECLVGPPDPIQPLSVRPDERFDLVVIAYQIWFLSPSLPLQAFLRSPAAKVLDGTPVITLCVSRNMWHSGSETMKRLLHEAGAVHLDNVVVTHPGPPATTLVSVPRALLYGKRDRFLGVFPPAELGREELERVERLGAAVAARLDDLGPHSGPLLTGLGAVDVKRRYIVPEFLAWYAYRGAAKVVSRLGRRDALARRLAIGVCVGLVLFVIFCGLPVFVLLFILSYPFVRGPIDRYVRRLAAPSG